MKEHEIREMINELRTVVWNYNTEIRNLDGEFNYARLRELISTVILPIAEEKEWIIKN